MASILKAVSLRTEKALFTSMVIMAICSEALAIDNGSSVIENSFAPGQGIPSLKNRMDLVPGRTESLLSEIERKTKKTLPVYPIPTTELIPIDGGKLPPIKLEAVYNESISLKKVLELTLERNLPIKIANAGYDSSKYSFFSSLGRFLPSNSLIYRVQNLQQSGDGSLSSASLSQTVSLPVFKGGQVLFGAISAYDSMKSQRYTVTTTINDRLLEVFHLYNDLLLQRVMLQVKLKAVEVSRSQLALNLKQKQAGTGTSFALAQSTTQLALDKQALLKQQIAVRDAALNLSTALNLSMEANIVTDHKNLTETPLVAKPYTINELLGIAMTNRPELKKYDYLYRSKRANIAVNRGQLFPSAQFFLSYNGTTSGGAGSSLGLQSAGVNQTGGSGVAGVGVQSASNPSAGSSVVISSGSGNTGISVGGLNHSFTAGFDLSWTMTGMGTVDTMNMQSARALARQAMLQYNEQVISIEREVRSSYLNTLAAEEQIDVAGEAVISSQEELRLATIRLENGIGTNLELIQAQNSYIKALTEQAQSIISFNNSQAKLLRDMGVISVATLIDDLHPFSYPKPSG